MWHFPGLSSNVGLPKAFPETFFYVSFKIAMLWWVSFICLLLVVVLFCLFWVICFEVRCKLCLSQVASTFHFPKQAFHLVFITQCPRISGRITFLDWLLFKSTDFWHQFVIFFSAQGQTYRKTGRMNKICAACGIIFPESKYWLLLTLLFL